MWDFGERPAPPFVTVCQIIKPVEHGNKDKLRWGSRDALK